MILSVCKFSFTVLCGVLLWLAVALRILADNVRPPEIPAEVRFENLMPDRVVRMTWIGTITDATFRAENAVSYQLLPHAPQTFRAHYWHMHLIEADAITRNITNFLEDSKQQITVEETVPPIWHLMVVIPGVETVFIHDVLPTFGYMDQHFIYRTILRLFLHPYYPVRYLNHRREFVQPCLLVVLLVAAAGDLWASYYYRSSEGEKGNEKSADERSGDERSADEKAQLANESGGGGANKAEEVQIGKEGMEKSERAIDRIGTESGNQVAIAANLDHAREIDDFTNQEEQAGLRQRHPHSQDTTTVSPSTLSSTLSPITHSPLTHLSSISHPPLTHLYSSHDRLKGEATVAMIMDHFGRCIFPDNLWFRVISRAHALPIFFFLNGFGTATQAQRQRKRHSPLILLLGYAFLKYVAGLKQLSQGSILMSHAIADMVFSRVNLQNWSLGVHCLICSLLLLLHPIYGDGVFVDAGMASFLFAAAGQLRANAIIIGGNQDQKRRSNLYASIYLACGCLCHASNSFRTEYLAMATKREDGWDTVWLPATVALSLFLFEFVNLSRYQRRVWRVSSSSGGGGGGSLWQKLARFLSRHGVTVYVVHVVLFDQMGRYLYGDPEWFRL